MRLRVLRFLLVVATCSAASLTRAEQPTPSALQAAYVVVEFFRELPPAVRHEIERRSSEPIADVGEPFRATDVVVDNRPCRRFVFAGHARAPSDLWVVCYEHGGRGYHYHVALFELINGSVHVIKAGQWLPEDPEKTVQLKEILSALRRGEIGYDNHW